ncbi:MAG: hypothetical protein IKE55_05440, partial [Kiritimatiellae bacterium]|nr:hypothetical protein [Kiritimatiellia bacterium]
MKKLLTTFAAAIGLASSTFAATVNLENVTTDTTLNNGDVIYGELGELVQISIATGATVTLSNATINLLGNSTTKWAGLTCNGGATTIILEGNNTVYGPYDKYPAIFVTVGCDLTIKGEGSLWASGGDQAAGIGGGNFSAGNAGNIFIEGGTISAYGGAYAAGIGSGQSHSCGNIVISGGTVIAIAESGYAAGIGCGASAKCGSITITGGKVTAKGGHDYAPSIGANISRYCGIVYIGEGIKMVKAVGSINCFPRLLLGENLIQNNSTENDVSVRTITSRVVNLADITENTVIEDGKIITGTLAANVKVSIADGATVTLRDATINGVNDMVNCAWAGLTCEGDATIILEGNNTVKGFYENNPGIYVPEGCTLTIRGDGSLNASSNGYGAGIGGGWNYVHCGNIRIEGGTITATGGYNTPGIGSGRSSRCGDITITKGVTSVTATKGSGAPDSIGVGNGGSCGTVTIGGVVGEISQNPYVYAPNRVNLASKTSDYTAADGDVMYGETTHTVTVPAGAN